MPETNNNSTKPPNQDNPGPLGSIGAYTLIKKIAEGGMGSIFLGKNKSDDSYVAIKLMSEQYAHNPVLVKRFEQEYKVASKLEHPNLVKALYYGDFNGNPYLVLEYIHGESLGRILERKGRLDEIEAIRIIAQVANGLNRAHRDNLIHRDVKPENILLTKNGTAKLTDMGLVKEKFSGDLNLTRSGRGLGTPNYMAPEQFRDAKNADERCDIYSLGATLYTLLTGELPYKSINPLEAWMKKVQNELVPPREINPKISERTDWAIRRAMDGDPEVRPKTCREFVEDLTGQSTRNSGVIPAATTAINSAEKPPEIWFLAYLDEDGKHMVVKGSAKAIRRSFKEEMLEDPSKYRVSKKKEGPFKAMREVAEFRDLAIQLSKAKSQEEEATESNPFSEFQTAETSPYVGNKSGIPKWIYFAIFGGILAGSLLLAWFISRR